MTEKLSIFVPLRIAPSDAFALNRAARTRNVPRSELLRQLIRSLGAGKPEQIMENPPAAKEAC